MANTENTTPRKRVLGDMTMRELLVSAQDEIKGLEEHLRGLEARGFQISDPNDSIDLIKAYVGSTLCRIEVAKMKLDEL